MVYFHTKIFGGPWNEKCWHILWPFGLFYDEFSYFMAIWYILWPSGTFFHVSVCCTQKNLATLVERLWLCQRTWKN
jgi:hypothetical protein